ncbi:hypothetical protein BDQ17DRAFT_1367468 [Cyathus striatus]|nr:hypothetical protein BDQ17DRAFT_1367468 [Cyathus striatus]
MLLQLHTFIQTLISKTRSVGRLSGEQSSCIDSRRDQQCSEGPVCASSQHTQVDVLLKGKDNGGNDEADDDSGALRKESVKESCTIHHDIHAKVLDVNGPVDEPTSDDYDDFNDDIIIRGTNIEVCKSWIASQVDGFVPINDVEWQRGVELLVFDEVDRAPQRHGVVKVPRLETIDKTNNVQINLSVGNSYAANPADKLKKRRRMILPVSNALNSVNKAARRRRVAKAPGLDMIREDVRR